MVHRYAADIEVPRYDWDSESATRIVPHIIETFESLNEFYAEAKRLHNPNETLIRPRTEAMARDGIHHDKVPSILEIVSEAILASNELKDVFTFSPMFDVAGDYVDVGRFVEGEPECMVSHPLQVRSAVSPVITLVSSADSNVGGDWETRGIIATALGMAISRLGYATEMWADNYGIGGSTRQYQRIKVKGTSDELNPARLMYGFGHSSMLTQLAFGCYDGFTKVGFPEFRYWQLSRGTAADRNSKIEALYPEGTIFLTGDLSAGATPAQMAQAVTAQLRLGGLIK